MYKAVGLFYFGALCILFGLQYAKYTAEIMTQRKRRISKREKINECFTQKKVAATGFVCGITPTYIRMSSDEKITFINEFTLFQLEDTGLATL